MIHKLLLSHGPIAAELLAAASKINGAMSDFTALCLDWNESFETSRQRTRRVLEGLEPASSRQVLVLVDIYGGTPYNVAATFRAGGGVELVAGVNLPMVVRLGCSCNEDMDLHTLAQWIRDKGRGSICVSAVDCRLEPSPTAAAARPGGSND